MLKRCPTCGRDMPDFHDFRIGERVRHMASRTGGEGTVTAIEDDGAVTVQFENGFGSGKPWSGTYDRNWFRCYPRGLVRASDLRKSEKP